MGRSIAPTCGSRVARELHMPHLPASSDLRVTGMDPNPVRLSKTMSHALRHAPGEYGLQPDAEGWVQVSDLLSALGSRRPRWRRLQLADLQRLNDTSDKRRFEILDGRIRAVYGHSLPGTIDRSPAIPPAVLFHGTSDRFLDAIRRDGLRPMRRQHVHLSADRETARQVGNRKGGRTVVLEVDAERAHRHGVRFFHGNEKIWLAEPIPPKFIHPSP